MLSLVRVSNVDTGTKLDTHTKVDTIVPKLTLVPKLTHVLKLTLLPNVDTCNKVLRLMPKYTLVPKLTLLLIVDTYTKVDTRTKSWHSYQSWHLYQKQLVLRPPQASHRKFFFWIYKIQSHSLFFGNYLRHRAKLLIWPLPRSRPDDTEYYSGMYNIYILKIK